MTAKEALEMLKNRTAALSLNHKIGSRDIAKQEVKEIVMSIKTHAIPTLEKALEQATKEHELLELYRLLVGIEEEYNTSGSILEKQKVLDDLRNVREKINQLEGGLS